MASLAGVTLTWRGTALDRIWALNSRGYQHLAPFGGKAGVLFLVLAVILFASGIGWLKRRPWAWRLAVMIILAQVIGDLVNLLTGHILEGVPIAAGLLVYLLRPRIRSLFSKRAVSQ